MAFPTDTVRWAIGTAYANVVSGASVPAINSAAIRESPPASPGNPAQTSISGGFIPNMGLGAQHLNHVLYVHGEALVHLSQTLDTLTRCTRSFMADEFQLTPKINTVTAGLSGSWYLDSGTTPVHIVSPSAQGMHAILNLTSRLPADATVDKISVMVQPTAASTMSARILTSTTSFLSGGATHTTNVAEIVNSDGTSNIQILNLSSSFQCEKPNGTDSYGRHIRIDTGTVAGDKFYGILVFYTHGGASKLR